jgi:glutamine synthetase
MGGGRVELRATDSACNPYLGTAMVLAAGLEGIEKQLDPGDPHTENMYLKSEDELQKMGVVRLPRTLEEAVDAFDADPLSEATFGPAMKKAWVDFKRDEWMQYLNHVSDWERSRYLKFF